MKKILFVLLLICFFVSGSFAAEVENIVTKPAGNRVLFEYDIVGEEEETEVNVALTIGGKTYSAEKLHLEGDYGKVRVGEGRRIYWDATKDFPKGYPADIKVSIVASGASFKDPLTGMEFVFIKGGCFKMGDVFGDGEQDEKPVHEVCLNDYYLGTHEVTQAQWKKIMGDVPSHFKGCDACPIEKVSWFDIQDFLAKMNKHSVRKYRLPTEAEWEYAARSGGKKQKWAGTSKESRLEKYAWYGDNSRERTHPVGQKRSNRAGLYDMTGNVWEWVSDWYDSTYYRKSPRENPKGAKSGRHLVLRGGSWDYDSGDIRTMSRFWCLPSERLSLIGFRVAFSPE